jgi:hypothetical protein
MIRGNCSFLGLPIRNSRQAKRSLRWWARLNGQGELDVHSVKRRLEERPKKWIITLYASGSVNVYENGDIEDPEGVFSRE